MCKESVGYSGGLLYLWRRKGFVLQHSFSGTGFLGVKGIWEGTQQSVFIFNIYAPCNLSGKRAMWDELRALRARNSGSHWCLTGDFNAVRYTYERKGNSSWVSSTDCSEFNDFIEDLNLLDLSLTGRRYTWHRADGSCMSRLDRFLISDEWATIW